MDVCMTSYEVAATHKALAAHDREDLEQSEDCMVWRDTPVRLRPRRLAITSRGLAVSQSRRDLEHIWASPKLADCFERGEFPDKSAYTVRYSRLLMLCLETRSFYESPSSPQPP